VLSMRTLPERMPHWIVCFSSGERSPQIQQGEFAGIASRIWVAVGSDRTLPIYTMLKAKMARHAD